MNATTQVPTMHTHYDLAGISLSTADTITHVVQIGSIPIGRIVQKYITSPYGAYGTPTCRCSFEIALTFSGRDQERRCDYETRRSWAEMDWGSVEEAMVRVGEIVREHGEGADETKDIPHVFRAASEGS